MEGKDCFTSSYINGKCSLSQKYGYKKVLFSLILLCVLWLFVAQYNLLKSPLVFRRSEVETTMNMTLNNGEVFIIKKHGDQLLSPRKNHTEYVLVEASQGRELHIYEGIEHLVEIMKSFHQYDGATCHASESDSAQYRQKLKSCWFKKRNWTMLIDGPSTLPNSNRVDEENASWLLSCNMAEFPFVIRRSVFNRIGLNREYGEATLLDFFLRSNGTLKIAVSQKCVFSKSIQSKMDQGSSGNKHQVFLDYYLLGHNHNILRIIRPNSIIWTKCSRQTSSCPDIPEQQTRADNILLPYCCKTLINEILIATVEALNQIGIGYRVCFSTLLGAIRSKTGIPWDTDVDFCLNSNDANAKTFEKLEKALNSTPYTVAYIEGMNRVIPMNALVKQISKHSLVPESDLFSRETLQYLQEMLPVPAPLWRMIPYADFYSYNKIFDRGKINVTINGLEYHTGDKPHELLLQWYGKKYMSTATKDRITSAYVGSIVL